MRGERRFNVLGDLDLGVLDGPDFQEDSVREEIIQPILKGLGYGPGGPHRIIRSRRLLHPFVSIGSATKTIHLVPDYLFEVNGKLAWLLEAKSPRETIRNSKHVEQAYSYAIHAEVRVPYFALCNGREFILYHVSHPKPVLGFDMVNIPAVWDNLLRLLRPEAVLEYDYRLAKDFGLPLKRLGFHEFSSLIFPDVPVMFIGQVSESDFCIGSGVKFPEGESYVATFDFGLDVLRQFRGKVPDKALSILDQPFRGELRQVHFPDMIYRVNVDSRVGDDLQENEDEIFLPLRINRLIDF